MNELTATTVEAMALLKLHRASYLEKARTIADSLIRDHGETDTQKVRTIMAVLGLLNPSVPDHWLGAVFNTPRYKWTGEWVSAKSPSTHAPRPVKVWTHA